METALQLGQLCQGKTTPSCSPKVSAVRALDPQTSHIQATEDRCLPEVKTMSRGTGFRPSRAVRLTEKHLLSSRVWNWFSCTLAGKWVELQSLAFDMPWPLWVWDPHLETPLKLHPGIKWVTDSFSHGTRNSLKTFTEVSAGWNWTLDHVIHNSTVVGGICWSLLWWGRDIEHQWNKGIGSR